MVLPHSSMLRTAFLLLLLVTATWLLGLLAVNSDTLSFHYLFAAFSCLQVGASRVACDLCPVGSGSEVVVGRKAPALTH